MPKKKPQLNSLDKSIMRFLAQNGRARDIEIAKAIGVSDDTVRRHRERLEAEDYFRVEAVFNHRKLEYTNSYQLGIVLTPAVDVRDVAERLANMELVHFVALSLGPTHAIVANCQSRDPLELHRFIEELRKWREIERIDVNIIYETVKSMFHSLPQGAF